MNAPGTGFRYVGRISAAPSGIQAVLFIVVIRNHHKRPSKVLRCTTKMVTSDVCPIVPRDVACRPGAYRMDLAMILAEPYLTKIIFLVPIQNCAFTWWACIRRQDAHHLYTWINDVQCQDQIPSGFLRELGRLQVPGRHTVVET